jgi:hypothetical protein
MMSNDEDLSRFAQLLIRLVRDRAIAACDRFADGEIRGPLGDRWREIVEDAAARAAVKALIPDIVDQTLAEFLNALDNGHLPLAWRHEDSTCVAMEDLGHGEMEGWLMMGQDGWRNQFSEQRFYDPFANLHLMQGDDSELEDN